MKRRHLLLLWLAVLPGCIPALVNAPREPDRGVPDTFAGSTDETNSADVKWSEFFGDPRLAALIDTALAHNQELNIVSLELDIGQYEVDARKGEYWPKVGARVGTGIEKVGRTTSQGVSDEAHGVPEHLLDFNLSLYASWEIDAWGKLRSATRAAAARYLASVEGRNFTITLLVQEIANSYYELLALDAQLAVLRQNLALQQDALESVRAQKDAARVTELAVKRFEAEVLKNESRQYTIAQQQVALENRINFLVGRFPQHVDRDPRDFTSLLPPAVHAGLPAQLLVNRPDVKQAELGLSAAALDVKVARASFFPSLAITAAFGTQSFDILKLVTTPASLFYNAATELLAPLFNRNQLTANYFTANSKQQQAVFNYERAILKGVAEVGSQLGAIENLEKSYTLRAAAAEKLNESSAISADLFASARADYVEVLLTRREALESQLELIETRKQQLNAVVNLYQALGGGWR